MAGVRDVRSKSGGTVRIISGEWRSRKIEVPSEDRTRPMLDRVKAAVFDTLGSWYGTPGRLPPIVVADVFAGGGTLGLEALSRGARAGVFFESNGAVLNVLRRNLAKLGVGARGAVEAVDAWSARLADLLLQYRCTLVFLDPPYHDAMDTGRHGKVMRLLDKLTPFARAMDDPLLVLHHPGNVSFEFSGLEAWSLHDLRRYGSTSIAFLDGVKPESSTQQAAEGSP
ncbi:MAG: RsmD family RNA methyltransferase [Planctomycetota bacterium]